MQLEKTRSLWWFLLPICLNLAGGLIAYFVLRHDDPAKARNCLLLGAALFAVGIATSVIFGAISETMPDGFEPGI